jgi:cell division septal protein FtsQ
MGAFLWLKKFFIYATPVSLGLVCAWYISFESDFFIVKQAEATVEYSSTQEALVAHLQPELIERVELLKGTNIWSLSLSNIRTQLKQLDWVKEVEVQRRFPSQLDLQISFQELGFIFVDHKNQFFPVSLDGTVMEPVRAGILPPAPILRNKKIFSDEKLRQRLLELYRQVPEMGSLVRSNIATVDYQPTTGLAFELISEQTKVFLGEEDIVKKSLQIQKVIDYLQSQNQKARVIDASFSKKVLVRPRKRS